jgi:Tfp pilus assembly protein PilX
MNNKLSNQRGLVLGVTLIVLMITLASVTAIMRQSGLIERVSSSLSDRNQAFQASETALQEAERWIGSSEKPFGEFSPTQFSSENKTGTTGLFDKPVDIETALRNSDVIITGQQNLNPLTNPKEIPGVSRQPAYLIELTGYTCINSDKLALFQVQARGWGLNPVSSVSLISKVRRLISCQAQGAGSDTGPPV